MMQHLHFRNQLTILLAFLTVFNSLTAQAPKRSCATCRAVPACEWTRWRRRRRIHRATRTAERRRQGQPVVCRFRKGAAARSRSRRRRSPRMRRRWRVATAVLPAPPGSRRGCIRRAQRTTPLRWSHPMTSQKALGTPEQRRGPLPQ